MNFNESFETARNFAITTAQAAARKAKVLAEIAKANVTIYSEEEKIRKAELQLGKLYYRDYAVGEEMDNAEYLPWCEKITESKQRIEELKDAIDDLKAGMGGDSDVEAAAEETADVADDVPTIEDGAQDAPVVIDLNADDTNA